LWACALAIVILAAGFAALAPGAAGVPSPIGPRPAAFSTLRVGELQEPDSLNPFVGVLSGSYIIWAHVYELLVGIGPDLTPIPALAASWEVDSTQLNWTFHLQHGVTWHDGQPFTAEDVNFTFRYIWAASAWNPIGCDLALLQSYMGDPTRNVGVDAGNITVIDQYTIRIPTYQPKANMLAMFIQIIPKHIWSGIACNQATHTSNLPPIGTGMYKFTSWVRGAYIQLDLNTAYWRLSSTEDYVDRIIISYYKDATALNTAFTGGTEDATDALPADKFALLDTTIGGATSPNVAKLAVDAIGFMEVGACVASDALIAEYGKPGGRNWLLTNTTVRQALNFAADRANLVQNVLSGYGKPGSTLIPPATPFWHYNVTTSENYTFDLNKARALLNDPKHNGADLKTGQTVPGDYGQNLDPAATNNKDAFIDTNGDTIREVVDATQVVAGDDWGTSAPNSNQLLFTISIRNYDVAGQNAADRLEGLWDQVGIHVTTDVVSESKLIGITYACSEDLYWWGWGMDVDPDFALSVMTTGQILNWQDAWYSNTTYDDWYLLQQRQVDMHERQQTIWSMQKLLYKEAPYLIAWYDQTLTAIRSDLFTGLGDWSAHPGLGLTGYGNDLVMLTMRSTAGVVTNQCPTTPTIEGTPPRHVYVNVSSTFTANATDPENDPLTWIFSWDDAAATTTTVNTAAGVTQASASFAWNVTGTYNVLVSVNDNKCGSYVTSNPYQVIADPLPSQYGWLTGTVRDATDPLHPPIVGATVAATLAGGTQPFSDTTDALGQYNLTLAVGTYTVAAGQALYMPQVQTGIAVTQGVETVANFDLSQMRGYLVGTVTSSAGGALAGASIYVTGPRQASGQTDAQGHYNITLPLGVYNATAVRSGYVNKTRSNLTVLPGIVTTADFSLDPVAVPETGLSLPLIAGIAAVVVAAVAGATWIVLRRRKKAEEIETPPTEPESPPGPKGPP